MNHLMSEISHQRGRECVCVCGARDSFHVCVYYTYWECFQQTHLSSLLRACERRIRIIRPRMLYGMGVLKGWCKHTKGCGREQEGHAMTFPNKVLDHFT
jgi:hypothetical protein